MALTKEEIAIDAIFASLTFPPSPVRAGLQWSVMGEISMETKHTPGPWSFDDIMSQGSMVYRRIRTGREEAIGAVSAYKLTKGRDAEAEANARLIAAAPDLLAAARRVANLNPDAGEIGAGMLRTIVAEARAAIAKAEGTGQ